MTTTHTDIRAIQELILKLTRIEREDLAEWILNSVDFVDGIRESAPAYGAPKHLTVDEYLNMEGGSVRYEYIAGQIFPMSTPLVRHEVITRNVLFHFQGRLQGGPCSAFVSSAAVRLRVNQDDIFYLPDVTIDCSPLTETALERQYLTHPRVVVEVLSRSTEIIDRREKTFNYRHIASMEDIVLIAQRSLEVTLFRRADQWVPRVLTDPNDVLALTSVGISISLREIYERARLNVDVGE